MLKKFEEFGILLFLKHFLDTKLINMVRFELKISNFYMSYFRISQIIIFYIQIQIKSHNNIYT